ncbi:alanine racemase [Hyphococcus sp.]|uniref:alanine racemase n=1 Tax=Hyphococcus sp. TaxID=2038636 RepID=UPI0020859F07|nr:MAG: alanine racemase [Marinicaulis sp.]
MNHKTSKMAVAGASETTREGPWAEIDLGALCANYEMIADAAPGAEVAPAVKCDAYGLGVGPVARALAERNKCDAYFVVYAEEGAALRAALATAQAKIYCFAGPSQETLALHEQARLTPVLNSLEQAQLWAARSPGAEAAVHIDTGMNRLGAPMCAAGDIATVEGLNVTLVMSHLACGSNPAHAKNRTQRGMFINVAQDFPGARLSLGASAGALMGKDYQFDMVRPGIALYGGSPFDTDDARIKSVISLRAPVVQLRDLAPGETVGYGATFTAARPTRIATVALGYGDGYPRGLTGAGAAIVNGEHAPIVGRISMDFITLDVTDMKNPAKDDDYAEFFGPELRLHDVATASGRAAYDLLTGLGDRVDRRYL